MVYEEALKLVGAGWEEAEAVARGEGLSGVDSKGVVCYFSYFSYLFS